MGSPFSSTPCSTPLSSSALLSSPTTRLSRCWKVIYAPQDTPLYTTSVSCYEVSRSATQITVYLRYTYPVSLKRVNLFVRSIEATPTTWPEVCVRVLEGLNTSLHSTDTTTQKDIEDGFEHVPVEREEGVDPKQPSNVTPPRTRSVTRAEQRE